MGDREKGLETADDLATLDALIESLAAKAEAGEMGAADRLIRAVKERSKLRARIGHDVEERAKPKGPPLNPRMTRFVEAYLECANGTDAAEIAGYQGDRHTLGVVASRLLRDPRIRDAIEERTREDPRIATREERQRFWTTVMRGEKIKQLVDGVELVVVPTLAERIKAAQALGKSHGDFVVKVEHDVSDHAQIVIQLPQNGREGEA